MDKVSTGHIKTTIRLQVDPDTTKEEARRLANRLSDLYQGDQDESDSELYLAMVDLLERAGVTGDYNLDRPEFEVYIGNTLIAAA